jgi:hypothetical protein
MSNNMHYLTQGDSASQVKSTLTREDTGLAVDMSTKTSLLKVRQRGSSTVLFELTGVNINAPEGEILYSFSTNLNTIDPGYYEGEIEVTNLDGTFESVYELLAFQIRGGF